MSDGVVGVDHRVPYALRLGSGAPAVGVAAIDTSILVRNSNNAATVVAPRVEDGAGDYHFEISAAYSTANHVPGADNIFYGNITLTSTSPRVVDVIAFEVKFSLRDKDDLAQPGDEMDLITDALDADAVADSGGDCWRPTRGHVPRPRRASATRRTR